MTDKALGAHAPDVAGRYERGAFDRMLAASRPSAQRLARPWPWTDLLVGAADPGPVTTAVGLDAAADMWGRRD
jgi:hypothetical protein